MSERVQLLLSDRILGMTLVPEGRIWNYGIGLTQLWSANMNYAVQLDTPLLFWAEEHRPAAFLSVSSHHGMEVLVHTLTCVLSSSLPISKPEMTAPMSIITLLSRPCCFFSLVITLVSLYHLVPFLFALMYFVGFFFAISCNIPKYNAA